MLQVINHQYELINLETVTFLSLCRLVRCSQTANFEAGVFLRLKSGYLFSIILRQMCKNQKTQHISVVDGQLKSNGNQQWHQIPDISLRMFRIKRRPSSGRVPSLPMRCGQNKASTKCLPPDKSISKHIKLNSEEHRKPLFHKLFSPVAKRFPNWDSPGAIISTCIV